MALLAAHMPAAAPDRDAHAFRAAFWPLDEPAGATMAGDLTGNEHYGTLAATPFSRCSRGIVATSAFTIVLREVLEWVPAIPESSIGPSCTWRVYLPLYRPHRRHNAHALWLFRQEVLFYNLKQITRLRPQTCY